MAFFGNAGRRYPVFRRWTVLFSKQLQCRRRNGMLISTRLDFWGGTVVWKVRVEALRCLWTSKWKCSPQNSESHIDGIVSEKSWRLRSILIWRWNAWDENPKTRTRKLYFQAWSQIHKNQCHERVLSLLMERRPKIRYLGCSSVPNH